MNRTPFLTAWGLFKDRWPLYMGLAVLWLGGGLLATSVRMATGRSETIENVSISVVGNVLSVFVASMLIRFGLDRVREIQRPLMDAWREIPWGLVAMVAIANSVFQIGLVAIRFALGAEMWAVTNLAVTLGGPVIFSLVLPFTVDRRRSLFLALRDGTQTCLTNLGSFILEFGKLYGAALLPTICISMLLLKPQPASSYSNRFSSNYALYGVSAVAGLIVVPMFYLLSVAMYERFAARNASG